MLFILSSAYDWTKDATLLAWLSVISVVLGIIGIIIGYYLYRKGKPEKLITYKVISDTPLVGVREQIGKGKIIVSYEDNSGHKEEINDATLLTLEVRNSGTVDVPIWNSNDTDIANMEEPIEFEFKGRTVVGMTQVETQPPKEVLQQKHLDEYLKAPSPTPSSLGLPRCLLKRGQSIQLGILMKGSDKEIKPRGILIDGRILNSYTLASRRLATQSFIMLILTITMTIVSLTYPLLAFFKINNVIINVLVTLLIIFAICFYIVIFFSRFIKKIRA